MRLALSWPRSRLLVVLVCVLAAACAQKAASTPEETDPCVEDPSQCEGAGGSAGAAAGGAGTATTKDGGAGAGVGGAKDAGRRDSAGGTGGVKIIPSNGSTGCGKEYDPAKYPVTNINHPFVPDLTIKVGAVTRTYALYIPILYDSSGATPLVFGFHGAWGGAADDQAQVETMSQDTALFVYPLGSSLDNAGLTSWNWASNSPDLALFDALLAQIDADFCVDTNRIFAFGFDVGGYFTNSLGCYRGNKLRGIGVIQGGSETDYGACTGQVAGAFIAGTLDATVTPGRVAVGREAVMRQNNCGPETAPFDPAPCVEYTGCMTGYPVVWCEVPTQDHTQPWGMSGAAVWQLFASLP